MVPFWSLAICQFSEELSLLVIFGRDEMSPFFLQPLCIFWVGGISWPGSCLVGLSYLEVAQLGLQFSGLHRRSPPDQGENKGTVTWDFFFFFFFTASPYGAIYLWRRKHVTPSCPAPSAPSWRSSAPRSGRPGWSSLWRLCGWGHHRRPGTRSSASCSGETSPG